LTDGFARFGKNERGLLARTRCEQELDGLGQLTRSERMLGGTFHGRVLVAARQLRHVPGLCRSQYPQPQCFASFLSQSLDQGQTAIDPRFVTTEHLSHFDLWQMVIVNQSKDEPRLLQFIGFTRNSIEIEDGCLGPLLVDFDEVSSERAHAWQSPSGAKTFEAIDEYQRSLELAEDDRCQLTVLGERSAHELFGFGLNEPEPIQPQIECSEV
jgi:hypothetical protein